MISLRFNFKNEDYFAKEYERHKESLKEIGIQDYDDFANELEIYKQRFINYVLERLKKYIDNDNKPIIKKDSNGFLYIKEMSRDERKKVQRFLYSQSVGLGGWDNSTKKSLTILEYKNLKGEANTIYINKDIYLRPLESVIYDGRKAVNSLNTILAYLMSEEYAGKKLETYFDFSRENDLEEIKVKPQDGVGFSIISHNTIKKEFPGGWLIKHMLTEDMEIKHFEIYKKKELAIELIGFYLEEKENVIR